MSFADALAQHTTRKGPGCTMGAIETALNPADRTALTDALAVTHIAHSIATRTNAKPLVHCAPAQPPAPACGR